MGKFVDFIVINIIVQTPQSMVWLAARENCSEKSFGKLGRPNSYGHPCQSQQALFIEDISKKIIIIIIKMVISSTILYNYAMITNQTIMVQITSARCICELPTILFVAYVFTTRFFYTYLTTLLFF